MFSPRALSTLHRARGAGFERVRRVIGRMMLNVAVDGAIGLVPVWVTCLTLPSAANRRNVILLQRHLAASARR